LREASWPEITLFWDQSIDNSDPQSLILYELLNPEAFPDVSTAGS
jgi:hypothetical protein